MSADPVGAAWASLGVRRAELEVLVEEAVAVPPPSASAWRGALGRAAHEAGVSEVAALVVPDARPPGLWFEGWDPLEADPGTSVTLRLHVVGAGRARWPRVLELVDGLRVKSGHIRLKRVGWLTDNGRVEGEAFGPPVAPSLPQVGMPSVVHVVTEAPLQLTRRGRREDGIPAWDLLVRSAGERLRQVTEAWGEGELSPEFSLELASAVGGAVRAAVGARTRAGTCTLVEGSRRTGREQGHQLFRGVTGVWSYEGVEPSGVHLLLAATELGLGKGVAFGCGRIRLKSEPAWT